MIWRHLGGVACQCRECSETVNCGMTCSFCETARGKISRMQAAGESDSSIIGAFIEAYGKNIYRGEPNAFGWIIPCLALALGSVAVVQFIRRGRRRAVRFHRDDI